MFRHYSTSAILSPNHQSPKIRFSGLGFGLTFCFLSFFLSGLTEVNPILWMASFVALSVLFLALTVLNVLRIRFAQSLPAKEKMQYCKNYFRRILFESFWSLFLGVLLSGLVLGNLAGTWMLTPEVLIAWIPIAGLLMFALWFSGIYPMYIAYAFWFPSAKVEMNSKELKFSSL